MRISVEIGTHRLDREVDQENNFVLDDKRDKYFASHDLIYQSLVEFWNFELGVFVVRHGHV